MASGSNNAYRLSNLLVDGGTYLARELLVQEIRQLNFNSEDAFLKSASVMSITQTLHKKNVLKKEQLDYLYPQSGSVKIEELDITLLTCILVNCCQLVPSKLAVVRQLRQFRNTLYGHSPAFRIEDLEFERNWKDITRFFIDEATKHLSAPCLQVIKDLVKNVESKVLDHETCEKYINQLLEWNREDNEARDGRIGVIGRKVTDMENHLKNEARSSPCENPGPDDHQIKATKEFMKEISTKNKKAIKKGLQTIPTETLYYLTNVLEQERYFVLKGIPGSGKTFLGLSVLHEMVKKGYKAVMIETLAELERIIDNTRRFAILVDDFLGRFSVRESELSRLAKYPKSLTDRLRYSRSVILFTIRSKVYNESKLSPCYEAISAIYFYEIGDATFNKKNIMKFYARRKKIRLSTAVIDRLCNAEHMAIGFPLLCKQMRGDSDDIQAFFTKPIKFIVSELDYTFRKKACDFGLLLLVLLNKNRLDIQDPTQYTDQLIKTRTIIPSVPETRDELLAAAECLVGTYLRSDRNVFSIVHTYILESLFKVVLTHEPRFTLLFCPLEYIAEFSYLLLGNEQLWRWFLQRYLEEKESYKMSKCFLWKSYSFINFILNEKGVMFFFRQRPIERQTLFEDLCEYVPPHIIEKILFKAPLYLRSKNRSVELKAMRQACCSGRLSMVQSFVTVAKIPIPDDLVFHAIMPNNRVEMIKYVLQSGGKITARSADDLNLLHFAANHERYDIAKFILRRYPQDFELLLKETDSSIKLKLILVLNLKSFIKPFLLKEQSQRYFDNMHLIHIAADLGTVDTLRIIVKENEEDLQIEDEKGFNALHYATLSNSKRNLQYLISKGIPVESETKEGLNILHIAAFKGHADLLEYIMRTHMNIDFLNKANQFGLNALHFAAYGDSTRCLEILIQAGLQPDCSTSDGDTILHIAVKRDNGDLVDYILLRHFEVVHLKNDDGHTAYDLAKENGQMKNLFTKYVSADKTFHHTDDDSEKPGNDVVLRLDERKELVQTTGTLYDETIERNQNMSGKIIVTSTPSVNIISPKNLIQDQVSGLRDIDNQSSDTPDQFTGESNVSESGDWTHSCCQKRINCSMQ